MWVTNIHKKTTKKGKTKKKQKIFVNIHLLR